MYIHFHHTASIHHIYAYIPYTQIPERIYDVCWQCGESVCIYVCMYRYRYMMYAGSVVKGIRLDIMQRDL
jgi:hypothetical protein